MDDTNNNDDTRQSLYREFESEIVKAGNTEAYFDEADLIEIFDYASDMDDYIVKMEVLLYGARHYPASEALATRRAWFYSMFGEMDAAARINSRVGTAGVLNRLLSLRASGADDTPQTRAALDDIIDESTSLGDEDIIQLVDFCAEKHMLDWVESARPRIEPRCAYLPTYLYEYADRAEDIEDLPTARRLFEELTMMEPFTVDFWVRLAGVQMAQDDLDDALASTGYALAIDNGNIDALRLKGRIMYRLEKPKEEIAQAFSAVLDHPEANDNDISAYAAILIELGRGSEAAELLEQTVMRYTMSQLPLDLLMTIDFERARPYILKFATETALERTSILTWVREHLRNGTVEIAAKLLELFRDHYVGVPELGTVAEVWYGTRRYDQIVDIVDETLSTLNISIIVMPSIDLPYIVSLMRTGRADRAREYTRRLMKHLRENESLVPDVADIDHATATCLRLGFIHILTRLDSMMAEGLTDLPEDFDPISQPQS